MGRLAGRRGRLYANITSGGTAEPVAYLARNGISFATEKFDVTAQGDDNKVYVSGLPDVQGTYAGFFDDASHQFYTAAVDGIARKVYLYPNTGSTGTYWFGTALFDFSVDLDVAGAEAISGSWAAATAFAKVG